MKYFEAVELIKKMELKYPVMEIRYRGVCVWPFIRLHLVDSLSVNAEIKVSYTSIKTVLKSLFFYNPLVSFKRHNIWVFTDSERRKEIGKMKEQRISGAITQCDSNSLMIEKPNIHSFHCNKNCIPEQAILSEGWLLLFSKLFACFPFRIKLDNEYVLQTIINHINVEFNYIYYIRLLDAQRRALLFFTKIAPKPNVVFIEAPSNKMGYVWAFHMENIPVVEMQHGIINEKHIAYNGIEYESKINPDAICVYGDLELDYFNKIQTGYTKKIFSTGLYILDQIDQKCINDPFCYYRKVFKTIIVVSGQPGYEEILMDFVSKIAPNHPELLFVYVPRFVSDFNISVRNIMLLNGNIYVYLKWCDIHMTIFSTTGLEAHYFHKPVIIYDYLNLGSNHFKNNFGNEHGFFYINTKKGFNMAYEYCITKHFNYKEVFRRKVIDNIQSVLKVENIIHLK